MADVADRSITRDDIEAKFRALKDDIDDRATSAKQTALPFLVVGAVLLLIIAYLLGKRVGKKKSTIVEIRRI